MYRPQNKPRKRKKAGASPPNCFCCFRNNRTCIRDSATGCCANCKFTNDEKEADSQHIIKSKVRQCLDNLVEQSGSFSSDNKDDIIPCTLVFELEMGNTDANKQAEPSHRVSESMYITEHFYPRCLELCKRMDIFVWTYLSLQMRTVEDILSLVQFASLAGGYLALMFPMKDRRGSKVNDHAAKHVVKFSLLRFGDLLQDLLRPLRKLSRLKVPHEESSTIVAAAGVLFCEVEHTYQGCLSGKLGLLCDDPELEQSVRSWLKTISHELLWRLRSTCGDVPFWAEKLAPPIKGAKRNIGIREILMKVESPLKNSVQDVWTSNRPTLRSSTSYLGTITASEYDAPRQNNLQINPDYPSQQGAPFVHLAKNFEEGHDIDDTLDGIQYSTVLDTNLNPFQSEGVPYMGMEFNSSDEPFSIIAFEPVFNQDNSNTWMQEHDGAHAPSQSHDEPFVPDDPYRHTLTDESIAESLPLENFRPMAPTTQHQWDHQPPPHASAFPNEAGTSEQMAYNNNWLQQQYTHHTSSLYEDTPYC